MRAKWMRLSKWKWEIFLDENTLYLGSINYTIDITREAVWREYRMSLWRDLKTASEFTTISK